MIASVLNLSTLLNTLNTGTIVILASLGCLMTENAGMMNIGIDGMMLCGAFAAVMASWATGSWMLGLLFAMLIGLLCGLFYGVFVVHLKSDEFIIGVAFNIFATALTTFLLRCFPGQSGSFHPKTGFIATLPTFHFGRVGNTLVNVNLMVPLAFVLVAACYILLYKTPMGFHLRASGEQPESLRSAGKSPEKMKYLASLLCGLFCALSGAYLSLGYLSTFSEGMSASRGYVAVACVIFGRANPMLVMLAALMFSFIDAVGTRLQGVLDPTLTAALPYVGTILMMLVLAIRDQRKKKRA